MALSVAVHFEWMRPAPIRSGAKGFALATGFERPGRVTPLPASGERLSLLLHYEDWTEKVPEKIKWTGGVELVRYEPFKSFPEIGLHLARVKDADSALKFYNRFGSLFRREPNAQDDGDDLEAILQSAAEMWDFSVAGIGKSSPAFMKSLKNGGTYVKLPPTTLEFNSRLQQPEIVFHPRTLRDAIFTNSIVGLANGRHLKICPRCEKSFRVGRSGKRSHAKYCSVECQISDKNDRRNIT